MAAFVIRDGNIGSLKTKTLFNVQTNEYSTIIIDYGGRVEELVLAPVSVESSKKKTSLQKVLLSHNGDEAAITKNTWWKGMFLVPWANRIAYGKYSFYGTDYQLPLNENTDGRQNCMHGLLAGKVMTVESAVATADSAQLTLSYDFKNEEEGYPFDWSYEITYTLSGKGLDISISVNNTQETSALPMYIGWHPYFLCTTQKAVITFDKCTGWNHVKLNSNMNPTGQTSLGVPFDGLTPIGGTTYDDEYKATLPPSKCGQIKTTLYDPDTNKTVVLCQSPNMRFLQVFTGVDGAVAIEPMSGMADAFNNHDHLSVLSGKEQWQASFGVYLE